VVLALRQTCLRGFQVAKHSDLSRAIISRILTRHGLAKRSDLDSPPFVHVATDDASRMAAPPSAKTQPTANNTSNPWLHRYNWHRPHTALKLKTPVQPFHLPMNTVLRPRARWNYFKLDWSNKRE